LASTLHLCLAMQHTNKPIALGLLGFFLTLTSVSPVHAVDTCTALFVQTQVAVDLNELYSRDSFAMGPSFKQIFKTDLKGKLDYAQAGQIWKESISNLTLAEKMKLKSDLSQKKTEGSKYYNPDFLWNIDLLILSLDRKELQSWVNNTKTTPRSYKQVWQLALFIREFDQSMATELAQQSILLYPSASKNRQALTFNSVLSGFKDIIPAKRALMLLIKVSLGLPEQLESLSQNGEIKLRDLKKYLNEFQNTIAATLEQDPIITPEQQFKGLKSIQQQLKIYKKENPSQNKEQDYVIVDGSFANGLALTDASDIDIAIMNKSIRQHFVTQEKFIQQSIYESMQALGYTQNSLRIENIINLHPEFFTAIGSDINVGFVGTIAFKVSANKIELIVYDYQKTSPQKASFTVYLINEKAR